MVICLVILSSWTTDSDQPVNSLPNDKILDVTKFKAFADKLIVAKMMISLYDRLENTVGKGENAGYLHFLLFQQCFPKPSSAVSLKVGNCVGKSERGIEITLALKIPWTNELLPLSLLNCHFTCLVSISPKIKEKNRFNSIVDLINVWYRVDG